MRYTGGLPPFAVKPNGKCTSCVGAGADVMNGESNLTPATANNERSTSGTTATITGISTSTSAPTTTTSTRSPSTTAIPTTKGTSSAAATTTTGQSVQSLVCSLVLMRLAQAL
ncbi:hypothetical protein TcWFU_001492 [Taenia crassiceps]|uniref:Uncharacterized protein n=1 Tax=Taenia crassiceps TaxID=6207 RepID=A0ABR4Q258_9CEST